MSAYTFDQLVRWGAVSSINAYQRYLSPRKRFACPHRVLYNGLSCSDYVKQLLMQQSLLSATKLTSLRFCACQSAAIALQKQVTQQRGGCVVIPCCIPI